MNIIEQLHQLITPKVLELVKHHTGDDESKRQLLTSVYGILGARLSDESAVERVESLMKNDADASHDGKKLLDTLLQDEHGKSQVPLLTGELAKEYHLPESTTSATLTTATPLVLEQFKGLAGTGSISAYLKDKLEDFVALLPSWATALLPMGLLAGIAGVAGSVASTAKDAVSDLATGASNLASNVADGAKGAVSSVASGVSSATSNVSHEVAETAKKGGGFLKSLLPIIGLIILAGLIWLLLRSCQDKPAPVAKPADTPATQEAPASVAPANAKPATFSLSTDEAGNAVYACQGQAGGEGVFASIRTALAGVFGATDKCELNVSKEHADMLPVGEHLPAIFGLMKGVPNASLTVNDKNIRLNSTDPVALQKLIDGVKGIVPSDFVVEAEPQIDAQTAVTTSLESAKTALDSLTETATAEDVVEALNLQIINFATASHAVPDENKVILDTAAAKLTSLPKARLKITGHTDNKGNHAYNQKLSERRANAVREYLVSKGVPNEQIEIFGASSDEPVASNATEQGRFQNRRIEFTLIEKDGTITAVGNADNSQAVANANANASDATKTDEAPAKQADTK